MKILYCASEVTPYAKTGGLADVSGALPKALNSLGHECLVAMPYYRAIKDSKLKTKLIDRFSFLTSAGFQEASVYRHEQMLFIDHRDYFKTPGLYTYQTKDYPDNLERFAFFSKAVAELTQRIDGLDVLHCNDWQTALVPAYLKALGINRPATLFTIHNIAYQGLYDAELWPMVMLPGSFFEPDCMEYYGRINILKAGIVCSDRVSTVSPSYAKEITTPDFGWGLDGLLRHVSSKLSGIINGIDTEIWNPAADELLPASFEEQNMAGKAVCKEALQRELNLSIMPDRPVFGLISRLVEQKGIDMILDILPAMVAHGCQIAVLGSGDSWLEDRLRWLIGQHQGSLGLHIGFNDRLAHLIEAGSDFFLMPSRFEPCGLNQMISMRYGTLPLVSNLGGLKDSVIAPEEPGEACGLKVWDQGSGGLMKTVLGALNLYTNHPETIIRLRRNAMRRDSSWDASAQAYIQLYSSLCNN